MAFIVKCNQTLMDDFKYEVFKDDLLIYEAFVDLYSPIVNLVKGEGLYSSKIRVFNRNDDQVLKIYKHVKNIISDTLFTIKSSNCSVTVREGKNFRLPDLYCRTPLGKITLWGEIKRQSYSLFLKDVEICNIKGKFIRGQKIYEVAFDESFSDLKLFFFSAVFIVDSMYHDY